MESELPGIIQVKVVAKNILLGSCLGPWGPNTKLFLQCHVTF